MYDKELINKICDLSCSFSEIEISQDSVKYDINNPFKKYYKLETIITAINKYKNGEITDKFLSYWASLYNWVICGGFNDNLIEEKGNIILELVKALISDTLDALSFFDGDDKESLQDYVIGFNSLEDVYSTINNWVGYYTLTEYSSVNNDQYILLVNDIDKKFIVIYSDFIDNGYKDEVLSFVNNDVFKLKVNELQQNNYVVVNYDEELYFKE